MRVTRFTERSVTLHYAVIALALAAIGCDNFVADQRQVVARDEQWTITAVGDLQASGRAFRANLIRFEAARSGVPYADGDLYEAGSHDHSFAFRYDSREWVSQNALRLAHIPPPDLVTVELRVRNETQRTIKYLIINTDELFLVLQLPPRMSVAIPTRRWGDFTSVNVRGVFDSGASFRATSGTFEDAARHVEVIVCPDRVDMSAAR